MRQHEDVELGFNKKDEKPTIKGNIISLLFCGIGIGFNLKILIQNPSEFHVPCMYMAIAGFLIYFNFTQITEKLKP